MRAVVFGATGQVGQALLAAPPANWQVIGVTRAECDITDMAHVEQIIGDLAPDLIFNAAAYTAVDKAEAEPDLAFKTNAQAVGEMASAASTLGGRFVQISTDMVFDGEAEKPYRPDDLPNPLSVYGLSKFAGERAALDAHPDSLIVRTAWVYSPHGPNFVRALLDRMARGELGVVTDQVGSPTYAEALAAGLWAMAEAGAQGIHHLTDAGHVSRYDFALAIAQDAVEMGLLSALPVIQPLLTQDYPAAASRPRYSVLNTASAEAFLARPLTPWHENLRHMLGTLQTHD